MVLVKVLFRKMSASEQHNSTQQHASASTAAPGSAVCASGLQPSLLLSAHQSTSQVPEDILPNSTLCRGVAEWSVDFSSLKH